MHLFWHQQRLRCLRKWWIQILLIHPVFDHKQVCISKQITRSLISLTIMLLPPVCRIAQRFVWIRLRWSDVQDWIHRDIEIEKGLLCRQSGESFCIWSARLIEIFGFLGFQSDSNDGLVFLGSGFEMESYSLDTLKICPYLVVIVIHVYVCYLLERFLRTSTTSIFGRRWFGSSASFASFTTWRSRSASG